MGLLASEAEPDAASRPALGLRAAALLSAAGLVAVVLLRSDAHVDTPKVVGVHRWPLPMLIGETDAAVMSHQEASKQCPQLMKEMDHPCCWTRAWNCPSQAAGRKGVAMDDGTLSYHCCCSEEYWKLAHNCPANEKLSEAQQAAIAEQKRNETKSCKEIKEKQEKADPNVKTIPMPPQCKVSLKDYATNPMVKAQCKNLKSWKAKAEKISPKRCSVDPATKMMTCKRNDTCASGRNIKQDVAFVKTTLTYECGDKCQGSLLINCCNTCQEAAANPMAYGVSGIECGGCSNNSLIHAAQEAHCQMYNGAFRCESSDMCTVGKPHESCNEEHNSCDVYPCGDCGDEHLKARCCADCLDLLCDSPEKRMMCEGCFDQDQAQPWWNNVMPHPSLPQFAPR